MNRSLFLIALLTSLPLMASEPAPQGAGGKPEKNESQNPEKRLPDLTKLPGHVREKLAEMPPHEREKFLQNMRRWKDLGDDERQRMKEMGREQFKRMREEMDDIANALGLTKNSEVRKQFEARYREERRKVEKSVIEQMRAIRKPLLDAMHSALKQEFAPATPSPPPAQSPSPAP